MWIGNSMLFNWLDRNLVADSVERGARARSATIWLLHSGGFYFVEKTLLDGQPLPRPLHWFKWQAYTTWLSGVALLVVVYYAGGRAMLADPTVVPLSHRAAVARRHRRDRRRLGTLRGDAALGGARERRRVAAAVWLVGSHGDRDRADALLLSGRAAFLHVGAMLGTIMAGNVCADDHPVAARARRVGGRGRRRRIRRSRRAPNASRFTTTISRFPSSC